MNNAIGSQRKKKSDVVYIECCYIQVNNSEAKDLLTLKRHNHEMYEIEELDPTVILRFI